MIIGVVFSEVDKIMHTKVTCDGVHSNIPFERSGPMNLRKEVFLETVSEL